jgi:hypothetical protein
MGWSGVGATTLAQSLALNHVRAQGERGLTWFELAEIMNWHHGTASGQLSLLDKGGLIKRLKERRGKSSVYVQTQFVNGRELAKPRKRGLTLILEVSEGVSAEDVKDYLNAQALCAAQEDHKLIDGWRWKRW